jgi:hypothetical protein
VARRAERSERPPAREEVVAATRYAETEQKAGNVVLIVMPDPVKSGEPSRDRQEALVQVG